MIGRIAVPAGVLCRLLVASVVLALLGAGGSAGVVVADALPGTRELATVLSFGGSDKLLVQTDAGATYRVQYIGIKGPVRSSLLHDPASAFHGPLVMGKRVVLESDGPDEEGGYKLRHVYLEGETLPVAVKILAAGWATAVPFPFDHRLRAEYLRAQEQAMAEQLNLWRPDILGPAAPWRPTGSGEAGYVAADPLLHPALDLLYTVPTGRRVLDRLIRTAPPMLTRKIPRAAGLTYQQAHYVLIDRDIGLENLHAWAAIIAHEGTHAIDTATTALGLTDFGCFETEERAFTVGAEVWLEFFGPPGRPRPLDAFDRMQNEILHAAQSGEVASWVRSSDTYQQLCTGQELLR